MHAQHITSKKATDEVARRLRGTTKYTFMVNIVQSQQETPIRDTNEVGGFVGQEGFYCEATISVVHKGIDDMVIGRPV